MTKVKQKKRKQRNSSGSISDGPDSSLKCKVTKTRGPSDDSIGDISVSEVLCRANAVLYEECVDPNMSSASNVFLNGAEEVSKMAEGGREPTNRDLMIALKDNMRDISDRLEAMGRKLGAIEVLEKKVTDFERELKKVWVALDDRAKKTEEKVTRLEDKVEAADIGVGEVSSRVHDLERQRQQLSDDVNYLKAQSMRNNLIFSGIPEDNSTGSETPAVTERKLRDFLHEKMKIARETVDALRLERVHRMPSQPIAGRVRNVVARFAFFKDREAVRQQWPELKGTQFYVNEQFPPEVQARRARLFPKVKAAKREGKRAWISYDTLYVDGKPVRD